MACDSQSLENLLQVDGASALSYRDKLICLAYLYGSGAGFLTAQSAVNNAAAQGMSRLSERDLWMCLEAGICS